MGCNCSKEKNKIKQAQKAEALRAGNISTVSLEVLQQRRVICKKCTHSSKNPHPKFAAFGGLTSQSICKISKLKLKEFLKDPSYECPVGNFKAATDD